MALDDMKNQDYTYDKLMEMFSVTGALAGGLTGQAGYNLAKPNQIDTKALKDERAAKAKAEAAKAKQAAQQQPRI